MGIEYDIDLYSTKKIYHLLSQIVDEVDCLSGSKLVNDDSDRYLLTNQYFTVYLSYSDEFQVETVEEVYGMSTNMHLGFRLHDMTIEGERCMMRIVDYLISKGVSDFVLEYNGEFPVVIRQDGRTKINHEYDDGSEFPFDIITGPVEVINMPCQ